MTPRAPRLYRMAVAWAVCIACSACGVALAVLIWWALPPNVKSPSPSMLVRLLAESLLIFGFLGLAGLGLIVGVVLCRRFLSASEIAKLTTEVSDVLRDV